MRCGEPQQDRLLLEQATETAGPHVGDELFVPHRRTVPGRLRCIGRCLARLARLREPLVERRREQAGQFRKQKGAQARARRISQVLERSGVDGGTEPPVCFLEHRREQVLERARLGLAAQRRRPDVRCGALQGRLDPDGVTDPGGWRHGDLASSRCKSRQHLLDRQRVAL